jgi:hypothetical protein
MEVKTLGGMPLWMTRALGENKIYPTSFSKYGTCYIDHIFKHPGQTGTGGKTNVGNYYR